MESSVIVVFILAFAQVSTGSDVVIGILGTSVSIDCDLPISDTLIWESSDGSVIAVNGHALEPNSTKYVVEKKNGVRESLVVHNLTLTDDIIFRCYDFKNSGVVDVTKVNIVVRPPFMDVTMPKTPLLEGADVTLLCEADGGKPLPEIRWYREDHNDTIVMMPGQLTDTKYTNGTGHRVNKLTFTVTRDMYRSKFICNVSVSVFYHHSFNVDVDVHLAPLQPEITGYHGSFDEKNLLKLACASTGSSPAATILWLIDGTPIGDLEFVVMPEQNGTYTMKSFFHSTLSRDMNGSVLTCAVTNSVIEDRGLPPKMENITLLVSYKPSITVEHDNYTVREGANVTLHCYVEALPIPLPENVFWMHEGKIVNRERYVTSNDTNNFSMSLYTVDRFDAGSYSCHASNRIGSSSGPSISVIVQFAPICASQGVQKYAAKIGESVRLQCHMISLPSDVLITWSNKMTNDVIRAMPANVDVDNNTHAYTNTEFKIRSQSDYRSVECYGNNTVGLSPDPCVFRIVPPSIPEPPSACSVSSKNSQITMSCSAGFNGGSVQTFTLQRLVDTEFEYVANDSVATISFESFENVSLRMCAINKDFPKTVSCGLPLFVVVELTDIPRSYPVKGKGSNHVAYIAGGITAFLGLIIICAIVIYLIRRQKKEQSSRLNSSSIETVLSQNKQHIHRKEKRNWRKSLSTFITKRGTDNKTKKGQSTSRNIRRCETVDVKQSYDTPKLDLKHISSTPNAFKNYRIQCTTIDHPVAISFVDEDMKIEDKSTHIAMDVPDVLSESTGFAISPIVVRTIDKPGVYTALDYLDDVIETHEQKTNCIERTELGDFYRSADIDEVLDGSNKSSNKSTSRSSKDEYTNIGSTTLVKDYSMGDIADVLDATTTNNESAKTNSQQSDTGVVNGTKLSFDVGFSESELQCSDDKPFVFGELSKNGSIRSFTGAMLSRSSLHASLNISGPQTININDTDSVKGRINKSYSLPYRSKKSRTRLFNKTNSFSNVVIGVDTSSKVKDKTGSKASSAKSLRCSMDDNTSDTASFSSAWDNDDAIVDTPRSDQSHFTDVNETILDVDEFTLTITSDTGTELGSGEYVSVFVEGGGNPMVRQINHIYHPNERSHELKSNADSSLLDIDELTLTINSETAEDIVQLEAGNGKHYTVDIEKDRDVSSAYHSDTQQSSRGPSPARRNSFLEAINNTSNEITMNGNDDRQNNEMILRIDSNTEEMYFNHGFEMDETCNSISTSDSISSSSNSSNAGKKQKCQSTADIDVVAYF